MNGSRAYWIKQYGWSRGEEMKGIVLATLGTVHNVFAKCMSRKAARYAGNCRPDLSSGWFDSEWLNVSTL